MTNNITKWNSKEWELGYDIGRAEALKEAEKIIEEINNPYPLDIFPEISDKQWKEVIKVINEHFLGFPFDRISSNLMRRGRYNYIEELKQKLKDKTK